MQIIVRPASCKATLLQPCNPKWHWKCEENRFWRKKYPSSYARSGRRCGAPSITCYEKQCTPLWERQLIVCSLSSECFFLHSTKWKMKKIDKVKSLEAEAWIHIQNRQNRRNTLAVFLQNYSFLYPSKGFKHTVKVWWYGMMPFELFKFDSTFSDDQHSHWFIFLIPGVRWEQDIPLPPAVPPLSLALPEMTDFIPAIVVANGQAREGTLVQVMQDGEWQKGAPGSIWLSGFQCWATNKKPFLDGYQQTSLIFKPFEIFTIL